LFYLPHADSEAAAVLQDRLVKALHARAEGRWRVACRLYLPTTAAATADTTSTTSGSSSSSANPDTSKNALCTLTTSAAPAAVYALVADRTLAANTPATNVAADEVFVVGDRELEPILAKLKALWALRQTVSVEGLTFRLHGAVVRTGAVLVGSMPRGTLLELTALDDPDPTRARSLLQSVLGGLAPSAASAVIDGDDDTTSAAPTRPPSPPLHPNPLPPPPPAQLPARLNRYLTRAAHGPAQCAYALLHLLREEGLLLAL
ncbi:hypothetical protein HK405_001298, partial [Cladochytrium tenue]